MDKKLSLNRGDCYRRFCYDRLLLFYVGRKWAHVFLKLSTPLVEILHRPMAMYHKIVRFHGKKEAAGDSETLVFNSSHNYVEIDI